MPDMAGNKHLPTLNESEVRSMQKEAASKKLSVQSAEASTKLVMQLKKFALSETPAMKLLPMLRKKVWDLIVVMGTRGYGAFKATVLGSTATRIAAISETPLLVIQA